MSRQPAYSVFSYMSGVRGCFVPAVARRHAAQPVEREVPLDGDGTHVAPFAVGEAAISLAQRPEIVVARGCHLTPRARGAHGGARDVVVGCNARGAHVVAGRERCLALVQLPRAAAPMPELGELASRLDFPARREARIAHEGR